MINLHNGKQQLHAELFGEHWKRADIPADNVVTDQHYCLILNL